MHPDKDNETTSRFIEALFGCLGALRFLSPARSYAALNTPPLPRPYSGPRRLRSYSPSTTHCRPVHASRPTSQVSTRTNAEA